MGRWSGKDIKGINTLSGRWHYRHCYKSEWKPNWRAYFKKGRRKDRRKESIYLKQTNFMLVVMQADFLLTFVLIHPWHSCISRFSTGISHICKMLCLEAWIPCQGAYTQHDTPPEPFLFSEVHSDHRITVSYCLTTGEKKTKTPTVFNWKKQLHEITMHDPWSYKWQK